MSFAYTFAGGMAFCTFLGVWIDQKIGTLPWFTLAGVFLGLTFGFYELWKVVRWLQRDDENNDDSGTPPTDSP